MFYYYSEVEEAKSLSGWYDQGSHWENDFDRFCVEVALLHPTSVKTDTLRSPTRGGAFDIIHISESIQEIGGEDNGRR